MTAAITSDSQVAQLLAKTVKDPGRVRTRLTDRVAYASDASHYLYTPQAVIIAKNAQEVGEIFRAGRENNIPVTLRSGGTSLAGQASGDGILVDVRMHFKDIEVLDGGLRVRVQPGATVRQVNTRLSLYSRKLGPDPASEAACTIGGVIANNSSGMACGTEFNTYRTLESMVFVLPSGTVVDTAAHDADKHLRTAEPELFDTLVRLQKRVRFNPESVEIIQRHFALKNTLGYGLNSFLDHDSPVQLLAHLIIGSEGTLAFVAEAVFATVPSNPLATTTVAVFPSLDDATRCLPGLVESGAATLELMDATSLRVGQKLANVPAAIKGFEVGKQAALLVEYHATEAEQLADFTEQGTALLGAYNLQEAVAFSSDAGARATAWNFRKGLYASVAGARTSGTTALLEDIAVPVEKLAPTCESLQELFQRYGYSDSVIFGHAKDGNIHFMLTDRFEGDEALGRYNSFNEGMVDLVLSAGGNLKAEHGTGRAMAPYVRRQYGDELYEVMKELKAACDPSNILNPGVIIDEDPKAHVRNIKLPEPVEEEVDKCVECGYCEPVCPSRNLTLTPRQRIVLRRAETAARARGDDAVATQLAEEYTYDGLQTCAVDGMCQTACPVGINTGDLVRRLRKENAQPLLASGWNGAAKAWGAVSRSGSMALSVAEKLPTPLVRGVTTAGRAVVGTDIMPEYSDGLPGGGSSRRQASGYVGAPPSAGSEALGVYMPACVNSMFGPESGEIGVSEAFRRLLERAGITLLIPADVEKLCCGTPWSSKGYVAGHQIMEDRVRASIRAISDDGRLPVISDAASCTEGFAKLLLDDEKIQVIDAVAFIAEHVLPLLEVTVPRESLTLHPTCSSTHLGLDADMRSIADAAARIVNIPENWGCCAFAGDRGMLHPELTASATAPEAADVKKLHAQDHASCNRTCEIGMTRATGTPYTHILEVLEKSTRLF